MSTNIELEVLCSNIRNLRKHCKLSQKAMAQRLHIGIQSLRKLENGQIPPRLRIDFLFQIYTHFGYTPSEIVSTDVLSRLNNK